MKKDMKKIKVIINHPYPCPHCGKNALIFKSCQESGRCIACKKEANTIHYFLGR